MTLAGKQAVNLLAEINELQAIKNNLEKTLASWPLTLKDAPNGRFIVPKPPHILKSGWAFENQPAWKLE